MSTVTMPYDDSELHRIGEYVRAHLYDWLNEVAPHVISGPQILERMDQRFGTQQALMDARFEAQQETMDARFAAQTEVMKTGFAAVDKHSMDARFAAQTEVMKAGFAAVDKRFEGRLWPSTSASRPKPR